MKMKTWPPKSNEENLAQKTVDSICRAFFHDSVEYIVDDDMVFQEKLLLSKMEFPATHCFDEKTGVGFSRSFPDGGGKPSVLFYLLLEALGLRSGGFF